MISNNWRAIIVKANSGYGPVSMGIQNDYPNSCNIDYIMKYDGDEIVSFSNSSATRMRKLGFQVTANVDCIVDGTLGVASSDPTVCQKYQGFNCSADLMGYIFQLNSLFSFDYVSEYYFSVANPSFYFGNLYNFDETSPTLNYIVSSLNLLILANLFPS